MLIEPRAILLGLLISTVACGGSPTGPTAPATIRFDVDTLRLARGQAQTVQVKVLDGNHRELREARVSLAPVNDDASLVVQNGSVTGTSLGHATLIARLGKLTASLPVLVFGHPTGISIDRVSLGLRPYGVAVGDSIALVTQLDGQTVTRLSLKPFQITTAIQVGDVPTGISIDATNQLALVANQHEPSIGILDLATNRQTTTFSTGSTTFRTIFAANGRRAYATTTDGLLLVIDPAERRILDTLSVVPAGNGISFARGDSLVYLSSMLGGISVVNTRINEVVGNLPFSGVLQDIVASPDGASLFVANESSPGIAVLSAATGTLTSTISIGGPSFGMALTPDAKQLWVTETSGVVVVVDVATHAVVRTLNVGGIPRRIAFDRFGSLAIVSDEDGAVIMIR